MLLQGNAAINEGNYEGFLTFCSEDTVWTFVGDQTLKGIEAVREWMTKEYVEPPENTVTHLIGEGEFLTVTGHLTVKNKDGKQNHYEYSDFWRFRDDKIIELKAYVVTIEGKH